MIREFVLKNHMGFDTKKTYTTDMSVEFLYNLVTIEAPMRSDEDITDDTKELLLHPESIQKIKRLKDLYDNWDDAKCEPLDILKEEDFYMINNGFHRIIIAHALGKPTLPVQVKEGEFILHKEISFYNLTQLLEMVKLLFHDYKTIDEIITFLKDERWDKNKMKHMTIGYGNMSQGDVL